MGERAPEGFGLALRDAARYLGISDSTLRRWADAGRVGHRRTLGGQRRFERAELDRVLEAQRRG